MTRLQQVLFELDAPYMGHAYFVPGHALYNALARRVDDATRQALHVSHGVFVPGEWAEYPATHPDEGSLGKLAGCLPDIESYADWFLLRSPAHPWLLDSRPRDAHNTHDVETYGDRAVFTARTRFARPTEMRNTQRTVQWYVHCYVHADSDTDGVVPLDTELLDGIQVGAARNYGFGELSVADSTVIELDDLEMPRLRKATGESEEPCRIELVTPYVAQSEYPGAESQAVPWWWGTSEPVPGMNVSRATGMRRRETWLVQGGQAYKVEVLDHGQRVGFAGDADRVVETARNGILRVGTHSRFGFGELRVRPPTAVPQRARTDAARAAREAVSVQRDDSDGDDSASTGGDDPDGETDEEPNEDRARRVRVTAGAVRGDAGGGEPERGAAGGDEAGDAAGVEREPGQVGGGR